MHLVGVRLIPNSSNPLPPISRLESGTPNRRCQRLRRNLRNCYAAIIPTFLHSIANLRPLVDDNILERFLDVYDVRNEDLHEAGLGYTGSIEEEDPDSLKLLRIHQARYATLRRLLLCCLLSLDANGRSSDAARWRSAIIEMECLASATSTQSESLAKLLENEESVCICIRSEHSIAYKHTLEVPSPTSPQQPSPSRANLSRSQSRLQNQLRRISTLSNGIRSLQAKLYLLKEDSTQALANPSSEVELSEISASLRDQYDTLGADLQALMHAWESDKQALAQDITRQTRRMSCSSSQGSDVFSPRISLNGHLESVQENDAGKENSLDVHSPMSLPLSPPATDDGNEDNSATDEVFEAVGSPKVRDRSSMTREQRIAKMQEERVQQASQREKRETDVRMMQELQSVMKKRPVVGQPRRTPNGRVTSI